GDPALVDLAAVGARPRQPAQRCSGERDDAVGPLDGLGRQAPLVGVPLVLVHPTGLAAHERAYLVPVGAQLLPQCRADESGRARDEYPHEPDATGVPRLRTWWDGRRRPGRSGGGDEGAAAGAGEGGLAEDARAGVDDHRLARGHAAQRGVEADEERVVVAT